MDNTIKITSQEEIRDEYQLAILLREIAKQIENGYTRGYYPHWQLEVTYNENLEYNV